VPRPELLAPAGNWDCARAAVENGADAIYFGLGRFNARLRATNFTEADLPDLLAFLHRRGVRGYVTFNTLIFADELADAEHSLRAIISAGADALIVQDIGIMRLVRRISPDFPIHASTQLTVTSAAGVQFAEKLGCSLVVLARECSLDEIAKIRTGATAALLEVFVHGALCVAYSGQCLTSESLGGRSANRGECAQACRMTYDLISDGQPVELGDRRYLLSPQDLCGVEALPDLARAGVASLKIEGRLKTPEYVANVTRVYREALDKLFPSDTALAPEQSAALAGQISRETRYDLEMSFSRGLYSGWLNGIDNQRLVHARFGTKRGVFLGEVARVASPFVWLHATAPVKAGDGVVFDAGRPELGEEGGRIHAVLEQRGETGLRFDPSGVDFARLRPGQFLWKTSDPALEKRLRATFTGEKTRRREPVWFAAHGHAGAPLTLILRDEQGRNARADSEILLQAATTQPLTPETLRAQLDRLGDTPFALAGLEFAVEGQVMLPVKEINRVRRDAAARLDELRAAPLRWELREPPADGSKSYVISPAITPTASAAPAEPELIPLVRSLAQLEAAAQAGSRVLYAEFEDPKRYREAVQWVRAQPTGGGRALEIWVAPPRIFKTGEDWILKIVRSCEADGYLARNYDHLAYFQNDRRRGDFSLNVANPLTAEYFIHECGLERVTASYDLNIRQLDALLRAAPPAWFEVTLHQHMPLFHMEHCVFCAFLSKGKDYRDCGRPCDTHEVRLRDRVGALHTLKADAGCRNTLYNSRAQTGAEYAQHLAALGVPAFRVEFLHESPAEVLRTLASYRQLLRGEISGPDLWRELKAHNQLGVTRGTLA
jgi:U32 family peptidase